MIGEEDIGDIIIEVDVGGDEVNGGGTKFDGGDMAEVDTGGTEVDVGDVEVHGGDMAEVDSGGTEVDVGGIKVDGGDMADVDSGGTEVGGRGEVHGEVIVDVDDVITTRENAIYIIQYGSRGG